MSSSSPTPVLPSLGLGVARTSRGDSARIVATWLFICRALVWAMVVVGGVTRLTHSGLSITEWQPIVGTLPPQNEAQWQEAFARYQHTPEYQQVNQGMGLDEFKGIFWWEYFHRLLGRAIGVVFFLPLLWFIARRDIPRGYAPRSPAFSCSADCRARSAGTWSKAGWSTIRACLAVPADRASRPRAADLRRDVLGRACRCGSQPRDAAPAAPTFAAPLRILALVFVFAMA